MQTTPDTKYFQFGERKTSTEILNELIQDIEYTLQSDFDYSNLCLSVTGAMNNAKNSMRDMKVE